MLLISLNSSSTNYIFTLALLFIIISIVYWMDSQNEKTMKIRNIALKGLSILFGIVFTTMIIMSLIVDGEINYSKIDIAICIFITIFSYMYSYCLSDLHYT